MLFTCNISLFVFVLFFGKNGIFYRGGSEIFVDVFFLLRSPLFGKGLKKQKRKNNRNKNKKHWVPGSWPVAAIWLEKINNLGRANFGSSQNVLHPQQQQKHLCKRLMSSVNVEELNVLARFYVYLFIFTM